MTCHSPIGYCYFGTRHQPKEVCLLTLPVLMSASFLAKHFHLLCTRQKSPFTVVDVPVDLLWGSTREQICRFCGGNLTCITLSRIKTYAAPQSMRAQGCITLSMKTYRIIMEPKKKKRHSFLSRFYVCWLDLLCSFYTTWLRVFQSKYCKGFREVNEDRTGLTLKFYALKLVDHGGINIVGNTDAKSEPFCI